MRFFFVVIALSFLGVGCGDGKVREIRGQFMEGCRDGGGTKAICSCIFDGIENKYSRDQIVGMGVGRIPEGFGEFYAKSIVQCARE